MKVRGSWVLFGLPCAALGLLFAAGPALAQSGVAPRGVPGDREVVVVNANRHPINQLYASPATNDQWGMDWLGDSSVEPGQSFRVRLGRLPGCRFDIQVIFDDASREEARDVDVCRTRRVSFDGKNAVPAPDVGGQDLALTVANAAPRPIQQIFISASNADGWGEDRLVDSSLSVGDQRVIRYRGGCTVDLRVVFDNRAVEERTELDLCGLAALQIQPGWTTADVPPTPQHSEMASIPRR